MLKTLTVLSRTYCHLCDDMIAALQTLQGRIPHEFIVEIIDIDLNAHLETQYGDKVPVLLGSVGEQQVEICHYFMDEAKFLAYLADSLSDSVNLIPDSAR